MTIPAYASCLRRRSTAGALVFAICYALAWAAIVWSHVQAEAAVLPDWTNEPALTPKQGVILLGTIVVGVLFLILVNSGFEAADKGEE